MTRLRTKRISPPACQDQVGKEFLPDVRPIEYLCVKINEVSTDHMFAYLSFSPVSFILISIPESICLV